MEQETTLDKLRQLCNENQLTAIVRINDWDSGEVILGFESRGGESGFMFHEVGPSINPQDPLQAILDAAQAHLQPQQDKRTFLASAKSKLTPQELQAIQKEVTDEI